MKDWFKVENLSKIQNERMQNYENGDVDVKNDFDSYRKLYEGSDNSGIESHNELGSSAMLIADCLRDMVGFEPETVADMGGGVGFVANEISKVWTKTKVYSYDLGEYATKYGQEHFKNVTFINKAIDVNDIFEEGQFDVIFAREFYPFSRTTEWEYQKSYIDMFLNNIKTGGVWS
jgi:ubiquinone/menaquinone biosynthesis C-methylase UbiE